MFNVKVVNHDVLSMIFFIFFIVYNHSSSIKKISVYDE